MTRKINTATVFGATGHTGRCIIDELLSRSVTVTGAARDTSKASGFRHERVDLVEGSLVDAGFRDHVTTGRDAVILAVPLAWTMARKPRNWCHTCWRKPRLTITASGSWEAPERCRFSRVSQSDGPGEFPAAALPTAESHARLLDALNASEAVRTGST